MLRVGTTGLGENDAVTPLGMPDRDIVTELANPFFAVTVTVTLPVEPRRTERLAGETERAKSGGGGACTTSVMFAVRVSAPLVPVIVSG